MAYNNSKPYRSTRYQLGDVKPWVAYAADLLGGRYSIGTILGWGRRPNATDHDDGLALDFMTTNGQGLADAARANARALGVTYVIWNQRIWSVGRNSEGWRAMPDRGSPTANHQDHVHVSFTASPPPGFKGGAVPQLDGHATPTNPGAVNAASASGRDVQGAFMTVLIYSAALAGGAVLIVLGVAKTAGVSPSLPLPVKGTSS
jgi:hypothetical protein